MADVNLRFAGLLLLCSLVSLSHCGVPVLLWESSPISGKDDVIPALVQLDSDEFSNHIFKKVQDHKPLIVVFLEESLSVEDFSWQDDHHRGSFPQIQNITGMSAKMEFIPSVEDPISSIRGLTVSHNYEWKKYDNSKLPSKPGTILEVKLKDPFTTEDRPDLLRDHDGNIAEVYSQLLAQHSHIIAIFTGKQSSWVEPEVNRVRRDVEENNVTNVYRIYVPDKALIYSKEAPMLTDGESHYIVDLRSDILPDLRDSLLRISRTYSFGNPSNKITLRYRFEKLSGKWELRDIEYEPPLEGRADGEGSKTVLLRATQDISAPMHMSFESEGPITFTNGSIHLQFKDLKVQPWPMSSEFGEAEEKPEPFFTATIWSGLFVTFILALVLTWGITMLMDVRTMDRFDDPKGKTISVNTAE